MSLHPTIAHGLMAREDLPVPGWLFGWAAACVLIISFVALGFLWRKPKLEPLQSQALMRIPSWLEPLCGGIGIAVFVGLIYAGLTGAQSPLDNALPTFVYVFFWASLVPISAIFGNLFRAFNPWRATARLTVWLLNKFSLDTTKTVFSYPKRLGRWPAVVGLIGFGWLELVADNRDEPKLLASLALGYAIFQLIGMALYGIERWTTRADTFSVYFELFSRISPFTVENRVLLIRKPFSGLTQIDWLPGTIAMLCAALGITVFDGASQGKVWISIATESQRLLVSIGLPAAPALKIAATAGLLMCILLVGMFYILGIAGMRSSERSFSTQELRRLFGHSLVPLALAYVFAHYFSLIVFQGQATAHLVSDPLGHGTDLFGTADIAINYGVVSATQIWYLQVGALIAGHVAGLALAHDRALSAFKGNVREATRSQYWMLIVMVGFTSLGLWLLSQANA